MWYALVTLFSLPGWCHFVWHDGTGSVTVFGGSTGTSECIRITTKGKEMYFYADGSSVSGSHSRPSQNFAGLSKPLLALTRKGVILAWTPEHQVAFDTLKACLLHSSILGFPTEEGRFILDTDVSLFALRGVLNQFHDGQEVVISLTFEYRLGAQHANADSLVGSMLP